jgi:uncharacterized damage-inducible protein DinB
MSIADSLLPEFDEEMAAARRMLERVPDGKTTWQPHEKSMTLGRLATHVAQLPGWAVNSVTKDELDIAPPGAPPPQRLILDQTAKILELFDKNVQEARQALATTSDAEFAKPWAFKLGGRTMWTRPKLQVYRRMMMSHLVHHRAQLGVYLRLNGVPVPGMYGPSADEARPAGR